MKRSSFILLLLLLLLTLISCSNLEEANLNPVEIANQIINDKFDRNDSFDKADFPNDDMLDTNETGKIYLYGELHGKTVIIEKELELWKQYYHDEGMRHLFKELPYFTAELLNVWMSEESDEILEGFDFNNWGIELELKDFYRAIKTECPDTIFHGTDIGLGYLQDGIKFRHYLEENELVDTVMYTLNEEAIEQGKHFKDTRDDMYRESKMVENFTREFNKLMNQSIMGIYGSAHTSFEPYERENQTVETMAYQLNKIYVDRVQTTNLTSEILNVLIDEPISIDQIDVAGKTYQTSYFGKMDIPWSSNIEFVEYWRLDNAYEDLSNSKLTGETIIYYYYPMLIEKNQIYMMIATLKDNTTMTMYSMSDGDVEDDLLITKGIIIDE